MSANEAAMKVVVAKLANDSRATQLFTRFDSSARAVSARVPMIGSNVMVRAVANESDDFTVGITGVNSGSQRWLHDFLVVDTRISFTTDGKEIHATDLNVRYESLVEKMISAAELVLAFRKQEERGTYPAATTVNTYWSSGTLNFGDWVGPHLLKQMTGRQPIQGNRQGQSTRILYTVGSVAGWFKRNNVDVWGSGLIKPLSDDEIAVRRQLKGIKVHAVRGKLTQKNLVDSLGWEVPDVYGDPALLLPDMISKPDVKQHEIALVPHYVHRDAVLSGTPDGELTKVVDVRRDIRDVIPAIAASNAVVSSSLHGLITAQAYGIPWVWLDVQDQQLTGKDFKFNDFFSCLDKDAVSRVSVSKSDLASLPIEEIAKQASLPALEIDLSKLRNSLPVPAISTP
ncbi:polysaccharide pyruvyl transferase family protein [Glutamicibacter sp. M10]|uniref:polysaccharide pyruvyl transferase family protein n=1 Tax=Glutamicibacter sp. M10 TaxID=3023076 RepID=UPI0021C7E5D3|nr:polysaccharide pyruvyl transferase family protein [Glutamicibacter sp. M10]UXN31279.1 polysaccharide pyruvyl transferase family protein [Glutamicibacter sp. M10]